MTDPFDMTEADLDRVITEADPTAHVRAALAEAFPGGFRVEHPVREPYPDIPEAARAAYAADTEEEIRAARRAVQRQEELRDALITMLAGDNAENAERGDYVPVDSNRKGHRRDKEIAVLRQKVTELEDVVDQLSAALSGLRRHVQFHGTDYGQTDPEFVYGCHLCDGPSAEERATHDEIQAAARAEYHEDRRANENPQEG